MGVQPILPVREPVIIDTMLNFDGDFEGDGDGDVMCKLSLNVLFSVNLWISRTDFDVISKKLSQRFFHWCLRTTESIGKRHKYADSSLLS